MSNPVFIYDATKIR